MHDHGGGGGGFVGGGSGFDSGHHGGHSGGHHAGHSGGHHDASGGLGAGGSHHSRHPIDPDSPALFMDLDRRSRRTARRGSPWPAFGTPRWYGRLVFTLAFLALFCFVAYQIVSGF